MPDIVIIDDDQELFALLDEYLEDEGFRCEHAADAATGLAAAARGGVDALILDVMLPGMNGLEVLRRIRASDGGAALPVLMLTARGEEIDRVVGLEMGADDYLGKPFSPRELVARLRALLRRADRGRDRAEDGAAPGIRQAGDIGINKSALTVTVRGEARELTVPELRLLNHLVESPGEVVGREFLYRSIFGHPAYPMDRSLDMLVSRLRRKLGTRLDGGERIKAVRGEGYMYLIREEAP